MATGLTITESLAEIKTIGKRLEKKRASITQYIARQEAVKDPLQKEGGSATFIKSERQAIRDLEQRVVDLRRSIRLANEETVISIDGESRTISDWLTWRREVAPGVQAFLNSLRQAVMAMRSQAQQRGVNIVSSSEEAKANSDLIVNIDEKELAGQIEHIEKVLGELDGQLSLKNATVTVKE